MKNLPKGKKHLEACFKANQYFLQEVSGETDSNHTFSSFCSVNGKTKYCQLRLQLLSKSIVDQLRMEELTN